MKWIGLTGGIASGKSAVTAILRAEGFTVVDADQLAREVVQPGSFGLRSVTQVFGRGVLSKNLELDRTSLGREIFADAQKREWLEHILHPLIRWRALEERMALSRMGLSMAFYDAALIYERKLDPEFDAVVVVTTSPEIQVDRLMHRDKITLAEAQKRIDAQMPLAEKAAKAHHVIDNSKSLEQTKDQVLLLLRKLGVFESK
jgi:dephospho-CoA kinase